MASGEPVVQIIQEMPPSSSAADSGAIIGASSPAEKINVWDFDAASIEYMDYLCRLADSYAGGGLTIQLGWTSASATANVARLGAAIRAMPDDAEDLDTTAHTYDFNDTDCTAPSAAGEVVYDTITFTDGADMDSLAAGQTFILRVRRNASHANDNMTGDARLVSIAGKET